MTNKAYWKTRALLLEALLDERSTATVEAIARLYDLAQADILAQIERIFARYVKGGALSEEQALKLLSVRETEQMRRELLELLEQAEGQAKRDIWARLSAPAYANRISRLQALQDRLYAQCRALGAQEISLVRDRLRDTLEQSYYRSVFDIQQGTGQGWSVERLGSKQVTAALAADWNGKHWSKRIWDNNETFARSVQDTVTTGIMTGQTYKEMRDNLLHTIGADPGEGAKYNAARLVKTETAYIANQGHLMGYQQAGIETYIYLATLDLRTSQVCRGLDMKRFPVSEAQAGTNLPPMHPHCRSTTMPDMKPETLKKLTRFARDPVTGEARKVPGDMTYSQWYHQYVAGNPEALAAEAAVENRAGDGRQFRAYHEVLGDKVPKTLDEFQQMKYNKPNEWGHLKHAYRTVNLYETNSGSMSVDKLLQLDEKALRLKRDQFPSAGKKNGNIGVMELDGEFRFAHSGANIPENVPYKNFKGDKSLLVLKKPENEQRFSTQVVGRHKRDVDSEAKLFEYAADRVGDGKPHKLNLLSERCMCDSCLSVMRQFKTAFPNVEVNAVSARADRADNNKGNPWKRRR